MPINDPVIYITFDEASGSTLANSGSDGATFDLTTSGSPTVQTGSVGNARRFPTLSDFASANNVPVPFTGDHTMSCRVLAADLPNSFDEWLCVMLGWRDAAGMFDALFSLRVGNDGLVVATVRDSGGSNVSVDATSSFTVDNGAWHTISYRYTAATALLEVFVDGVERASTDAAGSGVFDFFGIANPAQLRVGGFSTTTAQQLDIDEFRIYDRLLDDSEMAELHSFTGDALEPISGTVEVTEENDMTASAAALLITASVEVTEEGDTCNATAHNANPVVEQQSSRKRGGGKARATIVRQRRRPEPEKEKEDSKRTRPPRRERSEEAPQDTLPETLEPFKPVLPEASPELAETFKQLAADPVILREVKEPRKQKKVKAALADDDEDAILALLLS